MNLITSKNSKIIKFFFVLLPIILIILFNFKVLLNILFPIIFSLVLSYFLSPVVNLLIKKGIKRTMSIIITYLVIGLTLGIFLYNFIPIFYSSLADAVRSIPYISEKLRIILSELTIRYQISEIPDGLKDGIAQNISNLTLFINESYSKVFEIIGKLLSNILFIVLIPFITFYILNDSEYLKEKVLMCIPSHYRTDSILTWYQIDLVLKRFIRGELLVALIVGILTATGMYIIGVKYSIVLGFIAGITNVIPYVGPFIGVIPSIIVALIESPILAAKAALVFLIIQQIESGIISPKIVGKSVGLHPITVIFIIILFEHFFGFIGMLFAVPAVSIIIIIYNRIIIRLNGHINS